MRKFLDFALFLAVCALWMGERAFGAPACPEPYDVTMEDGTQRRVRQHGDEFFNWTEAEDGFAVARGSNGRWQYAARAKGRWVPAGMTPRQRGREGRAADPTPSPLLSAAADEGSSIGSTLSGGPAETLAATPAPAKLLVILVSFADLGISTTASAWADKVFGASGKTVNTYYKQASKNRFWFNPAEETQDTVNDGVISVALASNHPNETSPTVLRTQAAVSAALTAANGYINFAALDADHNGYLSSSELHVVLVFAGYERAVSDSYVPFIWAHHWSLSSPPLLDNVRIGASSYGGGYIAVGEYHAATHAATIGVICHELGHNLTLPDLYDTDHSSDGVGAHCLMGAGNWGRAYGEAYQGQTPVLPSAYCRQLVGFSDVRTVTGVAVTNSLIQISDSTNLTDMVRINTPNSSQYFLIENRRISGFDAGLYFYTGASSGGGLAIWHVDASMADNATDSRRLVDLEEAASPVLDATNDLSVGSIQNYYYSGNATRFDETTFPSNVLNGGGASLARVYNVSASGATMTFITDEGASFVSLPSALDVVEAQSFTTGTPAWTGQSTNTHDAVDAAQSGWVSSTATNSYMSTVVTGPVQVAFWWKNGSSSSTDKLRYLVDGVLQVEITGSVDTASTWYQESRTVSAGAHTLRWELYTTRRFGFSCDGFVDQLTLTPLAAALAVDAPALSFPWTGGLAQLKVRNTGNTALLWQTASSAWCPLSPASGSLAAGATQQVAMACATNWVRQVPRSGTLTVAATNAYGSAASGAPASFPLSEAGRPPNPSTVFRVQ